MTCLMITHNLNQAINTGNRLLMMENGNIVLDIQGKEKEKLTVNKLLTKFKQATGNELNNDKILFSKQYREIQHLFQYLLMIGYLC